MKRIAAFFISFVLILSMFSGMAFADEQPASDVIAPEVADIIVPEEPGENIYDSAPILYETESITSDQEGIVPEGADDIDPEVPEEISDNDELLMEYMELSVSDSSEPAYSVFGLNHLTGINIKVYGLIKDCVSKVASGEESSTVFTFYMSDLGLDGRYSAADLGVSAVVSNGAVTSEAKAAMKAKLQEINLSRVNSALLFDCPAEFYWYEKSVGCSMRSSIGMGATYDYSRGEYLMYFSDATMVQFSYTVAEDYSVNHASGTYVVDTSVTTSIQTAIDHANEIITDHANEADYQKLVSYKDEICNAVKYNTAAGNHNYTYNYGNPWQLIWVFDNDTSTNVVCEGYAKAFQFLCDGSKFRSHLVASRIVTGTMAGGTGAGGHMWNVVTMNDGKNYLVDVTNCDGGTIGYPNKLFLVGFGSGSATTGYSIPIQGQSTMTFTYDDNTKANYSVEELAIASKAYDPSYTPVDSYTITFKDEDGTVLLERTYEYGTSAAAIVRPDDPEKDPVAEGHYVFTGWTPEIEAVSDDAVYVAEYALQQHQPGEPVIKNRVEATCLDAGSYEEVTYCSICGREMGSEIKAIPATGHNWGGWYVITAATEDAEGLDGRTCTNDESHTETRVTPKLPHQHRPEITEAKEATCTAEGNSEYYTCPGCGKYFSDVAGTVEIEKDSWIIPKKEHTSVVIPGQDATCTETGLTEGRKCSVCGEILQAQETIPATGHVWGEWYVLEDATEEAEGLEGRDCIHDPSHTETRVIPKLAHKHKTVKTNAKEATCTAEGNTEYWTCSGCGEYFSDKDGTVEIEKDSWIIPKKEHTSVVIPGQDATCTKTGLTDGRKCSVCGEILQEQEIIPAKGHNYGGWVVTKEATCTEAGSIEKVCESCGDKVTETISAKGHTWSETYTVDKAATCTEAGSESIHCTVCGAINETSVRTIPAKGHNYGDWAVIKDATCTENGMLEKVCGTCGNKVTETIHAKGHSWSETYTVDKAATCTEAGSESIHCTACGIIDETTVRTIPAKGHSYGGWTITKAATCTEAGTREKVCSVCGDKVTETIPAKGHAWDEEYTVDKAATCTEAGSESIHCIVCGMIERTTVRVIPALGHSYGDWIVTKEATCTEAGSKEKVCSVCSDKVTEAIPATGHSWGAWYEITPATEDTEGLEGRSCLNDSSHTQTRAIPKLAHKHVLQRTAAKEATCTEEGNIEYWTCTGCGKHFGDEAGTEEIDHEGWIIPKKAHTAVVVPGKEATCTQSGLTDGSRCSVCGTTLTAQEVIPAKGHSYGEWIITKEATCTEAGSIEKVCGICGVKETETIHAKGHRWSEEYTVDKAATCTEAGSESIHCMTCGISDETTVRGIPANGHSYGEWAVTKEASCTETGSKEKVCSICKDKVTETIPAKGHVWDTTYTIDKEATCTEAGSESIHCSVCGESDETTVRGIPAKGHSYGEWTVTKEATCTEAGSREKACSVCKDKVTETIPAKGHVWDTTYTVDKEATCTEAGSESIHCSVCGISDETTVRGIPAKGHRYGEWVVTKEATCTEEGAREKICEGCGDKITETIPAKGHTYGDWVVTKEATYDEEGHREKVCSVCGDKITGTIPKLIPTDGWVTISGKQYFYVNGTAKTKWHSENGKWYYLDPDDGGAMVTGLRKVGGAYYYMDKEGVMKTGWINDNGTWYYAQSSGALLTGWLQSGSTWYYMDPTTCKMATGWVKVGNTWYYMNPSGAMATGWVKDGDTWYYMAASGAMTTGWVKVGSSWYYMKSSGAMAASEWCGGYWLNANGTWTYQPRGSWKSNSTGWWFGDTSGWYAKNETLKINDVLYTFNEAGYWLE